MERIEAYVTISGKMFGVAYHGDDEGLLAVAYKLVELIVEQLDIPFDSVEPAQNGAEVLAHAEVLHGQLHGERCQKIVDTLKDLHQFGDLTPDAGPGSIRFEIDRLKYFYELHQRNPDTELWADIHTRLVDVLGNRKHLIDFIEAYYPKPHWRQVFYADVLRMFSEQGVTNG
jgi:hypothetical protein